MGRMDFAMNDVMASSSILSTTPSGTNEATIFITAPSCVSLPARGPGQSPWPFFSSFCTQGVNFTHVFLATINGYTLRLTYRTISNAAGN